MEFRTFGLDGPIEIVPRKIEDERGYFSEIFRLSAFTEQAGRGRVRSGQSVAERSCGNHSRNSFPVAIRRRRASSSAAWPARCSMSRSTCARDSADYGRWIAVTLTPEENNQLWIPVGFGHAFCTLEPNSVISYRVTNYYSPRERQGRRLGRSRHRDRLAGRGRCRDLVGQGSRAARAGRLAGLFLLKG